MESAPDITARLDRIESTIGTLARDYKRDTKQAQQHRQRSARKLEQVTEAAAWSALVTDVIFYGVCLGTVLIVDSYALIVDNLPGWAKSYFQFTRNVEEQPYHPAGHRAPNAHATEPINVGDTIAGYRVTSGYGARPRPCQGCSSFHPAIDLATKTGTIIHAPGEVEVSCKADGASGNYAEFDYQGITHQLLHLATCKPGKATFGNPIGTTGSTGVGTGPHLDVRVKQGGQRVYPSKQVITAILDPSAFKQAPLAESGEPPSDDLLKRAIGRAEGTRDRNGNPTAAFQGHTDPGWSGRCKNQGSFSYQHCASSPDEADRKWLEVLRSAEGTIQAQAQDKFGRPLSKAALVAALDAYTQSPDAGGKRFVKHLPTADPSPAQLIAARTAALAESRRVLGGPPMNVPADQQRRVNALLEQLY